MEGESAASGRQVLLVEDDPELRSMLARLLAEEGYQVTEASDGQTAMREALRGTFSVAVLDRGLPFLDGLELLTRLRRAGWFVPVLVLSAYGTPADRVAGLDAGAEDYVIKPFDVEELLARLRALLRRHANDAEMLLVHGGTFDVSARRITLDAGGSPVQLSARESSLLEALARRPTRVFGRDELRERVFGDAESENIVDTYVHYLRRKLGRDIVRTVHGVGYQAGSKAGGLR
ncbi:MAG TPA: response regulator transcription factor [Frankiaceae bacterium]|nr:response regulator transcription factor [Frankiaceae bacterium]